MDIEQEEMQFLGVFGIYAEPYNDHPFMAKALQPDHPLYHPPSLLHLPRPCRGLRPPLLQDSPQRVPIGPNPQSAPNLTLTFLTSSPPSGPTSGSSSSLLHLPPRLLSPLHRCCRLCRPRHHLRLPRHQGLEEAHGLAIEERRGAWRGLVKLG
ncbi:Isoleucine--tRNA ligase [Actinidia chinensis var. chinensis]|uniref:Isoleucine--tRNA ligase n=1 Tax=Actinidia chinensis var. chinensis TaxID=1590841 RepID=A0A2R6QIB9_ACTCC|nr:Isoleucine--tRNA ligase [Actinidia chinensis var. chinensis]